MSGLGVWPRYARRTEAEEARKGKPLEGPVCEPERRPRYLHEPFRAQWYIGENMLNVKAVVEDRRATGDVAHAVVGGEPYVFSKKVLRDGGVDLLESDGGRYEGLANTRSSECRWGV